MSRSRKTGPAANAGRDLGQRAGRAGRSAERAGRQAARSPWLMRLARVGLAAKGLLYLIIGYLAVQIALGGSSQQADNSGALQLIAQNTGGAVVLAVAAAGLAGLALWQAVVAVIGGRLGVEKAHRRVAAGVRALIYAVLCFTIVQFLMGSSSPKGQDGQSETMTAKIMAYPGGWVLLTAIGVAMIAVGAYQGYKGVTRKFEEDMALGALSKNTRKGVTALGVVGTVTFGLVLAAAGVFIAQAALTFDKEKAQGLDGTLRAFAETPAGAPLLVAVAIGLLIYGVFCFCEARWIKG